MPDILHTPNREQIVTSNAWAFLHWLRTTRGVDLPDWAALRRFSADRAGEFRAAMVDFARLPEGPVRLARHPGTREAVVLCRVGSERVMMDRDRLRHPHPDPPPQAGEGELRHHPLSRLRGRSLPRTGSGVGAGGLPADIADPLTRHWPPALLIRPLAELLLHADLRPDDRLLVANATPWPWLAALLEGTTVILTAATPATLLTIAAEERATVLVATAQTLTEAAFQRARLRPNLAQLRTIVATGGPLSPEGRTRVYTWIKADLLLLARTGDTFWGNPLEPVYARPAATPAFLTPPPSAPAIR
jgi:hypothetical protein